MLYLHDPIISLTKMSFSAAVGDPVLSSGGSSAPADDGLGSGALSSCLQVYNKPCLFT
jgi:hypothetical protein